MRSITAKLLSSIGIITIVFLAFISYSFYELTTRQIYDVIEQQASMALKFDLAIRSYVGKYIRPALYERIDDDEFILEAMSTSYVARSIFETVREDFPEYIIKFSADNPRNPINQAGPEELAIIDYFDANPNVDQWKGAITLNDKRYMAIFNARRMTDSCIHCHGNPEDAPASMIERYGPVAGFHKTPGKVIGMDTVAIPMGKITEKVWEKLNRTVALFTVGLLIFFIAIVAVIKWLLINRLVKISRHFSSTIDASNYSQISPIHMEGNDEICELVVGYNMLTEKLKAFYTSLNQKVEERTKRLEIANRQLLQEIQERKTTEKNQQKMKQEREKLQVQLAQAQKMESVGRLAGGVAHDFNNMLSVIIGHTDLALNKMELDDPAYRHLSEIRKAAKRSANLTTQLLAFARQQPTTPKTLHLNKTVEGMLKMLRRLIGEDIELVWTPGRDLWPVKIDPTQMDQILVNLCVNARDAIGGIGRITIETENTVLEQHYCNEHMGCSPGEYAMMAVSDNGCGMDPETKANIFEPFFTTKKVGEGTGLGLATVYGIIKQNRGYINVYSEEKKGSTFKIYLPKLKEKAAESHPTEVPRKPTSGHETILLVEDEQTILEMAQEMLEYMGYHVLAASSPADAIKLVENQPDRRIDLLITDVIMPEMNGRELSEHLTRQIPHLKSLFMSGYTADVIAHHGVLEKGVHFIVKPFSKQALALKLREILD